jgi:hypothetical protein
MQNTGEYSNLEVAELDPHQQKEVVTKDYNLPQVATQQAAEYHLERPPDGM